NGVTTSTNSINTNTISGATIFTLVISDGCTIPNAVAQYTVDLCTGISELQTPYSELIVYPNPTLGDVLIEAYNGSAEVYNSTGQLLFIKLITVTDNNISLLNKPEGCYFVRLGSNKIFKIIKE
ncbi:MAG: T9SS type A sorting domain-containing protein, partial [Bacteroidia bacterium]